MKTLGIHTFGDNPYRAPAEEPVAETVEQTVGTDQAGGFGSYRPIDPQVGSQALADAFASGEENQGDQERPMSAKERVAARLDLIDIGALASAAARGKDDPDARNANAMAERVFGEMVSDPAYLGWGQIMANERGMFGEPVDSMTGVDKLSRLYEWSKGEGTLKSDEQNEWDAMKAEGDVERMDALVNAKMSSFWKEGDDVRRMSYLQDKWMSELPDDQRRVYDRQKAEQEASAKGNYGVGALLEEQKKTQALGITQEEKARHDETVGKFHEKAMAQVAQERRDEYEQLLAKKNTIQTLERLAMNRSDQARAFVAATATTGEFNRAAFDALPEEDKLPALSMIKIRRGELTKGYNFFDLKDEDGNTVDWRRVVYGVAKGITDIPFDVARTVGDITEMGAIEISTLARSLADREAALKYRKGAYDELGLKHDIHNAMTQDVPEADSWYGRTASGFGDNFGFLLIGGVGAAGKLAKARGLVYARRAADIRKAELALDAAKATGNADLIEGATKALAKANEGNGAGVFLRRFEKLGRNLGEAEWKGEALVGDLGKQSKEIQAAAQAFADQQKAAKGLPDAKKAYKQALKELEDLRAGKGSGSIEEALAKVRSTGAEYGRSLRAAKPAREIEIASANGQFLEDLKAAHAQVAKYEKYLTQSGRAVELTGSVAENAMWYLPFYTRRLDRAAANGEPMEQAAHSALVTMLWSGFTEKAAFTKAAKLGIGDVAMTRQSIGTITHLLGRAIIGKCSMRAKGVALKDAAKVFLEREATNLYHGADTAFNVTAQSVADEWGQMISEIWNEAKFNIDNGKRMIVDPETGESVEVPYTKEDFVKAFTPDMRWINTCVQVVKDGAYPAAGFFFLSGVNARFGHWRRSVGEARYMKGRFGEEYLKNNKVLLKNGMAALYDETVAANNAAVDFHLQEQVTATQEAGGTPDAKTATQYARQSASDTMGIVAAMAQDETGAIDAQAIMERTGLDAQTAEVMSAMARDYRALMIRDDARLMFNELMKKANVRNAEFALRQFIRFSPMVEGFTDNGDGMVSVDLSLGNDKKTGKKRIINIGMSTNRGVTNQLIADSVTDPALAAHYKYIEGLKAESSRNDFNAGRADSIYVPNRWEDLSTEEKMDFARKVIEGNNKRVGSFFFTGSDGRRHFVPIDDLITLTDKTNTRVVSHEVSHTIVRAAEEMGFISEDTKAAIADALGIDRVGEDATAGTGEMINGREKQKWEIAVDEAIAEGFADYTNGKSMPSLPQLKTGYAAIDKAGNWLVNTLFGDAQVHAESNRRVDDIYETMFRGDLENIEEIAAPLMTGKPSLRTQKAQALAAVEKARQALAEAPEGQAKDQAREALKAAQAVLHKANAEYDKVRRAKMARSILVSSDRSHTNNHAVPSRDIVSNGGEVTQGRNSLVTPEQAAKWMPDTKVVDEDGKPMVVYHSGTFGEEGNFVANGEMHFGSKAQADTRKRPHYIEKRVEEEQKNIEITFENGEYSWSWREYSSSDFGETFKRRSDAYEDALSFINNDSADLFDNTDDLSSLGVGETRAYYLNIKNPKRVVDQGEDWDYAVNKAMREGYDGIVYENKYEGKGDSWIAFKPSQIKSADGTTYDDAGNPIPMEKRGDLTNEDIRYSLILGEQGARRFEENGKIVQGLGVAREILADREWKNLTRDEKLKIKLATGWEVGADGKWRFEAPNPTVSDTDIIKDIDSASNGKKVRDFAWLNNIDKLYPNVGDTTVRFAPMRGSSAGAYNDETNTISINGDLRYENKQYSIQEVILHEVQHAIQKEEGFARGGNPSEFTQGQVTDPKMKKIAREYKKAVRKVFVAGATGERQMWKFLNDLEEKNASNWHDSMRKEVVDNLMSISRNHGYDNMMKLVRDLIEARHAESPYGKYNRLGGEVESRNAERRTIDDWRTKLLEDTEDVSRDSQIILRDYMDAMSKVEIAEESYSGADATDGSRMSLVTGEERNRLEAEFSGDDGTDYLMSYLAKGDPNWGTKDWKRYIESIDWKKCGDYVRTYRAMEMLPDGGLIPPMASFIGTGAADRKINGIARVGDIVKSDENPELRIKSGKDAGKFPLWKQALKKNKNTGKYELDWSRVPAAYNPYIHSSFRPLNDQFQLAWARPNLYTVEMLIPTSEFKNDTRYWAEFAKNSIGLHPWTSGSVTTQLTKFGRPSRQVLMTQYGKINRVLSNEEVAQKIMEDFGDAADKISIPQEVFPPAVYKLLTEKYGVNGTKMVDAEAKMQAVNELIAEANGDPTDSSLSRMSLADGEEAAIYVNDGMMRDGTPVNFIDLMLDGVKLGETRTHNRMTTGKWVGLAKDGKVYGRVMFGKPIEIGTYDNEYYDSFIAGTNYDIANDGTKWYYPIIDKQDFRDNPIPLKRNGNYGVYDIPTGAEDTKTSTGEGTNGSYSFCSIGEAAGLDPRIENKGEKNERVLGYFRGGQKVTNVTTEMIMASPIGRLIDYSYLRGDFGDGDSAKKMRDGIAELFSAITTTIAKTGDAAFGQQLYGSAIFTGIKTNSDKQYGTTYDFPSICTKTQAMIDAMSENMVRLGRGLTKDEIVALYQHIFDLGAAVPCPECYVFSRWIGIGGMLDNLKTYQDQFGKMNHDQVRAVYDKYAAEITNLVEEWNANPENKDKQIKFGKGKGKLAAKYTKEWKKLTDTNEETINKGYTPSNEDLDRQRFLEEQMNTVKAMTWIEDVYFTDGTMTKRRSNFSVPNNVMFDLNNAEEFATKYPQAWNWRCTQGAGYGKAITPYAESVLGEGIQAIGGSISVMIKQKKAGKFSNRFVGESLDKKARTTLEKAIKNMKVQSFLGGQRFQSTSDARYENMTDYLLAHLEVQTMQGMVQLYTKVLSAVPFFAKCGDSINMSMMPDTRYGGLKEVNGELVPVDTSTGGADPVKAQELRKDWTTAGTITIGVNDQHIRALVRQAWRDFVIPYHVSGGDARVVASMRTIQEGFGKLHDKFGTPEAKLSTDYTTTQGDKVLTDVQLEEEWGLSHEEIDRVHKIRDCRLSILTCKGDIDMELVKSNKFLQRLYDRIIDSNGAWHGVNVGKGKVDGHIFPNEFFDTNVKSVEESKIWTMDYLEYCRDLGYLHRFSGLKIVKGKITVSKGRDRFGNECDMEDLFFKDGKARHNKFDFSKSEDRDAVEDLMWKVLVDRRMIGNDGHYQAQKIVNLNGVGVGDLAAFAQNQEGVRNYDTFKEKNDHAKVEDLLKNGKDKGKMAKLVGNYSLAIPPEIGSTMSTEDLLAMAAAGRIAKSTGGDARKQTEAGVRTDMKNRLAQLGLPADDAAVDALMTRAKGDADAVMKGMENSASSDIMNRLSQRQVEKYFASLRSAGRKGIGEGAKATKAEQKLVERQAQILADSIAAQTGISVNEVESYYGIDLADTVLAFGDLIAQAEKARGEAPAAEGETAEEEGEAPDTTDDSVEVDPVAKQEHEEKMRKFVQEWIEKAYEADAEWQKKREERKAKRKAAEKADKPADTEEEDSGDEGDLPPNAEDFAQFIIDKQVLDLKNPNQFAQFIKIMCEEKWKADHGLGKDAYIWGDPVALQHLRMTAAGVYDSLCRKLMYSGKREQALRQINSIENAGTIGALVNAMEFTGKIIAQGMVTEKRRDLVKDIEKLLEQGFGAKGRFKQNEEDIHRKVSGFTELWAREVRKWLWIGDEKKANELQKCLEELAGVEAAFRVNNRDPNSAKNYNKNLLKMEVLTQFGALYHKSLGEITDARAKIVERLENDTVGQQMMEREERTRAVADMIEKAVDANRGVTYDDQHKGKIAKAVQSVSRYAQQHLDFKHLLLDLARYCKDDQVRQDYEAWVNDLQHDIQRRWDKAQTEKRKELLKFRKAVESIYGKSYAKVMQEMMSHDPRFDKFGKMIERYAAEGTPDVVDEMLAKKDGKPARKERVREITVNMSKAQALQLYVSMQQKGYLDNVVKNGRQGQSAEMRNLFSKEDLRLIDWLGKWYDENREAISEVSKRIFGLPVEAEEANYFPVKPHRPSQGLNEMDSQAWSPFPPALTARVRHGYDFDVRTDIFGMWAERMQEQAQWKQFAELGVELRGIFGRQGVQSMIKDQHGAKAWGDLKAFINDILNGGAKVTGKLEFWDEVRGWTALAALGGNIGVMLKQTTSIPAFAFEIGWADMGKYFTSSLWAISAGKAGSTVGIHSDALQAMREIFESDQRKNRWDAGNSDEVSNAFRMFDTKPSLLKNLMKKSMCFNKWGDIVPALMVGQGVYRAYQAQGLSKEEAMNRTWEIINRTQQTGQVDNLTAFQRRSALGRFVTQFQTTVRQYTAYEIAAIRNFAARPNGKNAQALASATALNAVLASLYYWGGAFWQFVLGKKPDEETVKGWMESMLTSCWSSLFLLGSFAGIVSECLVTGGSRTTATAPSMALAGTVITDMAKIAGMGLANLAAAVGYGDANFTIDDFLKAADHGLRAFNSPYRDASKVHKNYFGDGRKEGGTKKRKLLKRKDDRW